MSGGNLGNLYDEEEHYRQLGYVPGLGLVLPVLGFGEPDLIVKREIEDDEYIHPGSDSVH